MGGRFEYRVFQKDLFFQKAYFQKHFQNEGVQKNKEQYLLSKEIHNFNIKIRDNSLDIKQFQSLVDGLEQWDLYRKKEFPIEQKDLCILFSQKISILPLQIERKDLIDLIESQEDMEVLSLKKKRLLFTRKNIKGEFTEIEVLNKKFHSVALESEDIALLQKSVKDLSLEDFPNVNYYKFLKELVWV